MAVNAKPCILWQNLLLGGTVTASTEAAGYSKENLRNWRIEYRWMGLDAEEQWVQLDAGAGAEFTVDSLAIAGHDLFAQGAEDVVFQHSANGSDWTNCHDPITPESDRPLAIFLAPPVTDRFFRLLIPAGYDAPPSLGLLFIGVAMEFPTWFSSPFKPKSRIRKTDSNVSREGLPLGGQVKWRQRRVRCSLHSLTIAWLEANWEPFFIEHDDCFFMVWDRENHPTEVWVVQFPDNAENDVPYRGSTCDLSFEVIGLAE